MLSAMADLVRVREKFQVTLPVGLRQQFAVREGDYLEAAVTAEGLVLRPQRLVSTIAGKSVSILDFLKEPRSFPARTRQDIETTLAADRDSWDSK
jgi:AbrB family looped-hinge helix DNA binding protein